MSSRKCVRTPQPLRTAAAELASSLSAERRICLVTGEIAGPDFNGGIGTANRGLALALRAAGFAVDVLYTRVERGAPFCFRGAFTDQVNAFAIHGIRLISIFHPGNWNDWPGKSYGAMEHLEETPYDFVFFNDTHGTAYYPLLARRTGNPKLAGTLMCVVAHSATQWIQEINQTPITTIEDIKLMEMERRSLELADFVVSPSHYLLRKYADYGWSLSSDCRVMPNLLPKDMRRGSGAVIEVHPIEEPVFFGRLESRKGLWLFCSALDGIKQELAGRTVTFLGKPTVENGESTAFTLIRRSAAWPFDVRLLHNYDREQALSYLKAGKRLAVMPSPQENSPCAIQECLELGIPFIASSGSGGEELLAAESRRRCLFEPTTAALTGAILTALQNGASTASLSFDPDASERAMLDWVLGAIQMRAKAMPASVTTVIAKSERPLLLAVAPRTVDIAEVHSKINHILSLFKGGADLVVLTEKAAQLAARIRTDKGARGTQIVPASDYASVATELAERKDAVVGIFHILQPVTPAFVSRARACMAADPDIAAVVGMVAGEDPAAMAALAPYVSVPARRRIVERYLLGNSPALIPLSQEMNDGFALFRSSAMSDLRNISPHDVRYGRFKRVKDWIDELLFELQSRGMRFELVPDCALYIPAVDDPFEVFRRGAFLRSLVARQLKFIAGSHQAMLARLAIETSLADDRSRAMSGCLSYVAAKLSTVPERLSTNDVSSDETIRMLAKMAHAAGQLELAEDLVGQLVMADHYATSVESATLGYLVRRQADEIRLFDLLAHGHYGRINLNHEWSFKLLPPERTFELHPNPPNEGRSTIVFSAVDLRRVGHFRGMVRLANAAAHPVRFRVQIIPHDRTIQLGFEQVAAALETQAFAFAVPVRARVRSDIVLTTEMAFQFDPTSDAWAHWIDPRFCVGGP